MRLEARRRASSTQTNPFDVGHTNSPYNAASQKLIFKLFPPPRFSLATDNWPLTTISVP